jgi:hypothetical protein
VCFAFQQVNGATASTVHHPQVHILNNVPDLLSDVLHVLCVATGIDSLHEHLAGETSSTLMKGLWLASVHPTLTLHEELLVQISGTARIP